MRITIQVNPALAYAQADLQSELQALVPQGTVLTVRTAPPPQSALTWGEIQQFILEYRKDIQTGAVLLTAVLQVIKAWLSRSGVSTKDTSSRKRADKSVILVIDGDEIALPASDAQQKKLIAKLKGQEHEASDKPPVKHPATKRAKAAKPKRKSSARKVR